jgi:hypothetical protein
MPGAQIVPGRITAIILTAEDQGGAHVLIDDRARHVGAEDVIVRNISVVPGRFVGSDVRNVEWSWRKVVRGVRERFRGCGGRGGRHREEPGVCVGHVVTEIAFRRRITDADRFGLHAKPPQQTRDEPIGRTGGYWVSFTPEHELGRQAG